MDKAKKHALALEIEIYLKKHPDAKPKDVKKFVENVASKTADIYPIENVWSILKAEAQQHAPIKDIETLKRILNRKWRHISNDRNLCRSMIASIPNRITAMIEKGGAQVHKADYVNAGGDA